MSRRDGLVPAGLYVEGVAVVGTPEADAEYAITVHRTVPVGLTERTRQVLKGGPRRAFSLGELARELGIDGPLWELNAALCKLVRKREVVKSERGAGSRMVKTYRWRLPSDP